MEENTELAALNPQEQKDSKGEIENVHVGILAIMEDENAPELKRLQDFRGLLNKVPAKTLLRKHPYISGSVYLPITHIEGLMDAFFFRQWGTRDFRHALISNEVIGQIEVWYIDPISKREITRVGTASIPIMVDAIPEEVMKKMSKQEKNLHALDVANKKSNALETGIPRLKAQCFKNACSSIGPLFGRDVNRDIQHVPFDLISQNFDNVKKLAANGGDKKD